MMTRIALSILLALVAFVFACTSSSSPTNLTAGNRGYDQEYREQTRGAQTYEQSGGQEQGETEPSYTIMLVSMETGDVYPGEDYYVYAVVDNPDNRDLEYVWSVADGTVQEVPESERGRLATLVEDEYAGAEETPAPTAEIPPSAETPVPPAGAAPATEAVPGAPAVATPPAPPGGQAPPPGAAMPGQQPAPTTSPGGGQEAYDPFGQRGGPGGGQTGETQQQQEYGQGPSAPGSGTEGQGSQDQSGTTGDTTYQPESEVPPGIPGQVPPDEYFGEQWPRVDQLIMQHGEGPASTDDWTQEDWDLYNEFKRIYEPEDIPDEFAETQLPTTSSAQGAVRERRVVGGEEAGEEADEPEGSENVAALAAELAKGIRAVEAGAGASGRAEPSGAANVVEEEPAGRSDWIGSEAAPVAAQRDYGIRSEYEQWRDNAGEPRRRSLGGYGNPQEVETLDEEESYTQHSFVTDEPYVLWTPRLPGRVKIYVRADYKGETLTGPRELEVEVRLRDPAVRLSDDFPDIIREDEPLYVALEAANIPSFYKGLFTLSFDANALSFRDAELGEFFGDAPAASLFYAQPDKTAGKVLLAIDSNTELTELGGDGVLAYLKFRAKQDLAERAQTQLALVMDTTARYILNHDGENVLPLPVEYPVFRTATTMPPALATYPREQTPGTEAGAQPQAPAQQQPSPAAPATQPGAQAGAPQPAQPTGGPAVQFGPTGPSGGSAPPSGGTPAPSGGTQPTGGSGAGTGTGGGAGTGAGGTGGTGTPPGVTPATGGEGPASGFSAEGLVTSKVEEQTDAEAEGAAAGEEGETPAGEGPEADASAGEDETGGEEQDSTEPEPEAAGSQDG